MKMEKEDLRSELDISILKQNIELLKDCASDYNKVEDLSMKAYIADACVKRFEYTVETSWKLMKKYLKLVYGKTDKELTMNTIFRLMEGYGFIKSWEDWRNYYERRNDTSHEYNANKAHRLLLQADKLTADCEFLYQQLKQALRQ